MLTDALKSIGIEYIFRNFLWKKKKKLNFLTTFYISNESNVKTLQMVY